MGSITRLQVGLPLRSFPVGSWNQIGNDLDWLKQKAAEKPPGLVVPRSGQVPCLVQPNATIIDHGIVVFDEPAFIPTTTGTTSHTGEPATLREPALMVKKPATATLDKPLLITLGAIAANTPGIAISAGFVWVRVDIQTVGDKLCGPVNGDGDKLKSGTGNIPILATKTVGTGVQWCLVQLGGVASATPFTCMVVSTLTAASWSNAAKELTPAANANAARLLTFGDAKYKTPTIITPEWVDTEEKAVADDKGRVGKGIYQDGRYQLFSVSCEEEDYTE